MKSRTDLATRIDAGMRSFAERMESIPPLADSVLTTRIVGEFSAGKTRMLSELLGDTVPEALTPISSRDAQTRLPLEVSYGPFPYLAMVERTSDGDQGKELVRLDKFPARGEIDELRYKASVHRLRLCVPLEHMILREGDGYEEHSQPSRMFLIDMPGWNSGEDAIAHEIAEVVRESDFNLALVYVTNANRLDSSDNRRHLHAFLVALEDAERFAEEPMLSMVITHCGSADAERMSLRANELVRTIWAQINTVSKPIALNIQCVDFNNMDQPQRAAFRQCFWQFLLAPLAQESDAIEADVHPWRARIRAWPLEDDIRPRLTATRSLLDGLRQLADRMCKNGQFSIGLNMHQLTSLPQEDIQHRLRQKWAGQIHPEALVDAQTLLESLPLQADHPLFNWWSEVWCEQARSMMTAMRTFCVHADAALAEVNSETPHLQDHLQRALTLPHAELKGALSSSFVRLADETAALDAQPLDQIISTLFVLTAMQGQYEKHHAQHLRELAGEYTDET